MSEKQKERAGDAPEKEARCPRCGGEMDDGKVQGNFGYISNRHRARFIDNLPTAPFTSARACYRCGYVEFHLDPETLRRHLEH